MNPIHSFKIHSLRPILTLSSHSQKMVQMDSSVQHFRQFCTHAFLMRATCPAHLNLLDLIFSFFPFYRYQSACSFFGSASSLFDNLNNITCWSRWPRGLRRRSAAAWLLGSQVRIPLKAWMFVVCSQNTVTGWSLVQRSLTVRRVCVIKKPQRRRPWLNMGCSAIGKKCIIFATR
jgi:hypothetical protein